jgi:hypothetical protein
VNNIPTSAYLLVGTLVLANLGTIVSILVVFFKGGVFVAETRLGIKDAKDAAVRAHKRIDKIEEIKT